MDKIELIGQRIDKLITTNNELLQTNNTLSVELANTVSDKNTLATTIDELRASILELTNENEHLKQKLESFESEKTTLETKVNELEEQTGMQDLELDELIEKLDSLANLDNISNVAEAEQNNQATNTAPITVTETNTELEPVSNEPVNNIQNNN
jgi:chromosome segregation ATPase